MSDLQEAAAALASCLPERALVIGSLPHDASDLDLLVRPAAQRALADWLPRAGFGPWGDGWLQVVGGAAVVVDLAAAASWRLPEDALRALFEDALPLPGLPGLAEPAPHHALLVLARRLATSGGQLDARRMGRARRALVGDPDGFTTAGAAAPAWGCVGALTVLERDLAGAPTAAAQRRHLLADDAVPLAPAWRNVVRRVRPRRRGPGVVVSLSGLDGAGKSSLIDGLVDALDSAGYDTAVLWHRLSTGQALLRLAAPAKAIARLAGRPAGHPVPSTTDATGNGRPLDRSGTARLWPVVVTVVHVLSAAPAVRWHRFRGRVVIRDRGVLDAVVHLASRYGTAAPADLHLPLLRWALPRPAVAWFIDVPAEEARRRKPEQFTEVELDRQRQLYLARVDSLDVQVLDGCRPPDELRDGVVRQVLDMLVGQGVPRG